jgi:hypothetical protein
MMMMMTMINDNNGLRDTNYDDMSNYNDESFIERTMMTNDDDI